MPRTARPVRLVVADLVDETDTVQRIVALRAEGMPLRAIAARLEADGRKTKRGGRWHASTVRAVLLRVHATATDLARRPEAA